ncbi:MAG: MCE family protein [Deinococcales bacterium]|nr:MCE family protein [Chitinophagaceae bacterium]
MKISNETKVGVLAAVAITLFVLGFNFLKGKSLFKTGNYLYAKYSNTKGIMISNRVLINGFQVGNVSDIKNADANLRDIIVTIKLKGKYNIPVNSLASIKDNPLGSPSMEIVIGNDTKYLQSGDTLLTGNNTSLFVSLTGKVAPIADQLKITLLSLDSVLKNVNSMFDANTKSNWQGTMANINKTTASLAISAGSIQAVLNEQSSAINQSMKNLSSFTKNLADNNVKVTRMMTNIEKTTENLSNADIDGSIASLKKAIDNMNGLVEKIGSKDGTLGLMMNDKQLYYQLLNTVRSTNILLDDFKTHPKRYVSLSVFGGKNKSTPLTAPLNDTLIFQK